MSNASQFSAIMVPVVDTMGFVVPGGRAYILFQQQTLTGKQIIEEKVRAELRKARRGGPETTSLRFLLPTDYAISLDLSDEAAIVDIIAAEFEARRFFIMVDNQPLPALNNTVEIKRNTHIGFLLTITMHPVEEQADHVDDNDNNNRTQ